MAPVTSTFMIQSAFGDHLLKEKQTWEVPNSLLWPVKGKELGRGHLPPANPFIRWCFRKRIWFHFKFNYISAVYKPSREHLNYPLGGHFFFKARNEKEKETSTQNTRLWPHGATLEDREKNSDSTDTFLKHSRCQVNAERRALYGECWHHLNYSNAAIYTYTHLKAKRPRGFMLHLISQ